MKICRLVVTMATVALAGVAACALLFGYTPVYGGIVPVTRPPVLHGHTSPAPKPSPHAGSYAPEALPSPAPNDMSAAATKTPAPTAVPENTVAPIPANTAAPTETPKQEAPPDSTAPPATMPPTAESPVPPEELSAEWMASQEEEEREASKVLESIGGEDSTVIPPESSAYIPQELSERDAYIPENEARYEAFAEANPDVPYHQMLAYVNVRADIGYYSDIVENASASDLLVLCNKNNQLPSDYVPEGLRKVGNTKYLLRSDAASAFERMTEDMSAEGLRIVVYSGYRSYDYQKNLYARYVDRDGVAVADTYSARAGHSEHQTGLAIDFLHKSGYSTMGSAKFQKTDEYAWLLENAHRYGYILRYPSDYVWVTGYRFEPWHWRYVGEEAASLMHDNGITTFEEFWGTYLS